jgi:uncharacterized membrane protein
MTPRWERALQRWVEAGVVDGVAADRIRVFEADRSRKTGMRWPVILALAFGGLMLGAGVLLFVSAHWDKLSPPSRLAVVLSMVALFHVAAALVRDRFEVLGITLHAVGTAALGGGIFLTAQIFNLQENWPSGLMLWTLGAWLAWILMRDWPQLTMAAVLTPAWLVGEWTVKTEGVGLRADRVAILGIVLLAFSFLSARTREGDSTYRRALVWVGGLALFPSIAFLLALRDRFKSFYYYSRHQPLSAQLLVLGWLAAILLPLVVAYFLRGRSSWANLLAVAWVFPLAFMLDPIWNLFIYVWCAVGSVGLVAWGLREAQKSRINLGVIGFALTVLFFYFSSVMDKFGRSISLIGLGVLFLAGGLALERTRRHLVARIAEVKP